MLLRGLRVYLVLGLFTFGIVAEENPIAQTIEAVLKNLQELSLHEISRLPKNAKVFLSSEQLKALKERLEKIDPKADLTKEYLTAEQVKKIAEDGVPVSTPFLAALRLANEGTEEKEIKQNARKLLQKEVARWNLPEGNKIEIGPEAIGKVISAELKLERPTTEFSQSELRKFVKLALGKEKILSDEQWRQLLGNTRLNMRGLVGPTFTREYAKEFQKSHSPDTREEAEGALHEDAEEEVVKQGAPESLPAVEKQNATPNRTANGEKELLIPSKKEAPIRAAGRPQPGAGLGEIEQPGSVPGEFFSGGFSPPQVVFRSKIDPGSISPDSKAGVVGASPPDEATRQELLAKIAEEASKGITQLGVDLVSNFAGQGAASCKATNLKKEFNGFSCKMVFSSAKHCILSKETGQLASFINLKGVGAVQVSPRGGIGLARIEIPESFSPAAGADVAALHIERPGHCPSDERVRTFQVAHNPPSKGLIIEGRRLLIAGLKESEGTMMEVNLADPSNPIGIYPGDSGSGAFSIDNDGKLVFAGVVSAKFTARAFADRLGLVEAKKPIQDFFREQVEGVPQIDLIADNNKARPHRPESHIH